MKVKISTIDKLKDFVNITTRLPFEVRIVSGRHEVDAKSIMGILSLDLSKVLNLCIDDPEEQSVAIARNALKEFLVA